MDVRTVGTAFAFPEHPVPSRADRLRNAWRRPSLRAPQPQTPHCENALMPGWPRVSSRVFSPLAVIRWISDPLNVLLKRVKVMFAPFGENPGSAMVMPSGAWVSWRRCDPSGCIVKISLVTLLAPSANAMTLRDDQDGLQASRESGVTWSRSLPLER